MENYRLTNRADSDLSKIYEYGLLNFGLSKAQSYLLGLYDQLQMLAEHPLFGRTAEQLSRDLRRAEYRSHVIFYRQEEKDILIVRILREEMDFKQHI